MEFKKVSRTLRVSRREDRFSRKMKPSPFLLLLVIPSTKTGYNPDVLSGLVVIHTYITGVSKESRCSPVIKTITV